MSQTRPARKWNSMRGLQAIGAERYHHRHPFPSADARRQADARPASGLGAQSLLLPEPSSRSRTRRFCRGPRMPHFRRAWRKRIIDHDGDGTHPGGIEKWLLLAEATGLAREQAIAATEFCPRRDTRCSAYMDFVSTHASGGGGIFAHRAFLARSDHAAYRPPARALSVAFERARLFSRAAYAGARGRALRVGLGGEARAHVARNRNWRSARCARSATFCGPARRALFCVCRTGLAAAGRVRAARKKRHDARSRKLTAPCARLPPERKTAPARSC